MIWNYVTINIWGGLTTVPLILWTCIKSLESYIINLYQYLPSTRFLHSPRRPPFWLNRSMGYWCGSYGEHGYILFVQLFWHWLGISRVCFCLFLVFNTICTCASWAHIYDLKYVSIRLYIVVWYSQYKSLFLMNKTPEEAGITRNMWSVRLEPCWLGSFMIRETPYLMSNLY